MAQEASPAPTSTPKSRSKKTQPTKEEAPQPARSEQKRPAPQQAGEEEGGDNIEVQRDRRGGDDNEEEEEDRQKRTMNKALIMWAAIALLALYLISTTMQDLMRMVESVRSKYV